MKQRWFLFLAIAAAAIRPSFATVTFTATPSTLPRNGEPVTLTWSSNVLEFTASGGWSGTKSTNGSTVVYPMQTTTYSLTPNTVPPGATSTVTVTVTNSGMGIVKSSGIGDLGDSRLDGAFYALSWADFQPTRCDAHTIPGTLSSFLTAADNDHKKVVLALTFSAGDTGSDNTPFPEWTWDGTETYPYCSSKGVNGAITRMHTSGTNYFPLWWEKDYLTLAKNAIERLTNVFNSDNRILAYMFTGASGTLPTTLAGEQSDELYTAYVGEGFVPNDDCDTTIDDWEVDCQVPNYDPDDPNYGEAVEEILTTWLAYSTKPVIYVTRPLGKDVEHPALADYLEGDLVQYDASIALVDNGLRIKPEECDPEDTDPTCVAYYRQILRFADLQNNGHTVGWWSLGGEFDACSGDNGAEIAQAMEDAVAELDTTKVWFGWDPATWECDLTADKSNDLFNDPPVVELTIADADATESANNTTNRARFLLTRRGDNTGGALTVSVTFSGTASMADFTIDGSPSCAGSTCDFVIDDEESDELVTIHAVVDGAEGDQTVIPTIDTDASYIVGVPANGTMTIHD